jgi:hypothetical protein
VSAVNERTTGRGKLPQTVTGTGEDEIAALRDLDDRLRDVPQPDGSQMDELRRRLRLAYVEGAEEWSRRELGPRADVRGAPGGHPEVPLDLLAAHSSTFTRKSATTSFRLCPEPLTLCS